jgi:hypothetical protein
MKKIILALMMFASLQAGAQTQSTTTTKKVAYTQNGNVFTAVSTTKRGLPPRKTAATWVTKDGTKYPIYKSASGRCFILKVSKKSGKEYKYYLPKELDTQVK